MTGVDNEGTDMQPIQRLAKARGQALIQTLGLVLSTAMIGGLAIDTGFYYAETQTLRSAADAAALAAVAELFKSTNPDLQSRFTESRTEAQSLALQNTNRVLNAADMEFGYVDPTTGAYNANTFTTPSTNPVFATTGGFNAVRVNARAANGQANSPIPAVFTTLLGRQSFNAAASAVAIYGGGVSGASGLRPVYLCQAAWDYAKAQYGDATVPEITFYGTTLRVGNTNISQSDSCGEMGPGNWGLADFDRESGAPGNSTVAEWWANGYNGMVHIGEDYEVQTGTPIHTYNTTFGQLKNAQTIIQVPLYDNTEDNGSNALFHVSQIASFVITDYKTTGPESQRYIRGHFKKTLCTSKCTQGTTLLSGDVTKIRLIH